MSKLFEKPNNKRAEHMDNKDMNYLKRSHSDAERGESPKLKIAKMSNFGLKTAFFDPKNDRST